MSEPYHIIIVEEEAPIASVLSRLIERKYPSSKIFIASTVDKGLDIYYRNGADLLIVDHGPPRISGPVLIAYLRAQNDLVPIIGVSTDAHDRKTYMAAGASAFLGGLDRVREIGPVLEQLLPLAPSAGDHPVA